MDPAKEAALEDLVWQTDSGERVFKKAFQRDLLTLPQKSDNSLMHTFSSPQGIPTPCRYSKIIYSIRVVQSSCNL